MIIVRDFFFLWVKRTRDLSVAAALVGGLKTVFELMKFSLDLARIFFLPYTINIVYYNISYVRNAMVETKSRDARTHTHTKTHRELFCLCYRRRTQRAYTHIHARTRFIGSITPKRHQLCRAARRTQAVGSRAVAVGWGGGGTTPLYRFLNVRKYRRFYRI